MIPVLRYLFRQAKVIPIAGRREPKELRSQGPVAAWFHRRGWAIPVHLLLIVLAVANIYPFLWMTGTSFKTGLESSDNIDSPTPLVKYGLPPAVREELLAPFYDEHGDLAVEVGRRSRYGPKTSTLYRGHAETRLGSGATGTSRAAEGPDDEGTGRARRRARRQAVRAGRRLRDAVAGSTKGA